MVSTDEHRIRQNATDSPLLSLPSEVREKILLNLVGNNLIHVKHLSPGRILHAEGAEHWEECEDDSDGTFDLTNGKAGRFRHAICVATISEQEAYDERILADTTEDESAKSVDLSCEERHQGCMMTGSGPFKIPPEEHNSLTMDLQVLGACRQLYEECNHLLWATNTFSFDDATSLDKFLGSLNLAQKRNLSNIHISAHNYGLSPTNSMIDNWTKAFKLSFINVLSGVQNLHLCLQSDFGRFLQYYSHDRSYESLKENLDDCLKPFLRLRAIDAKNITVLLNDDVDEYPNLDMASKWNRSNSNEYAETLRAQLAAPNGVELVKADAEKANAGREIAVMRNAKCNVTMWDLRLKDVRRSVQRLVADAEECDQKADRYVAKAAKVIGDSKKAQPKGIKLQRAADRSRAFSKEFRHNAEGLEGNVTFFAIGKTEAVAKYKRAKARVQARRVKNGEDPGKDISATSDEEFKTLVQDQEQGINETEFDSDITPSPSEDKGRETDDEDEGAPEDEKAKQSKSEWDEFDRFLIPKVDDEATDADDELDEDYAP